MKKIKIELVYDANTAFYRVTKLVNAALVEFQGNPIMIGSDIGPRIADAFARDRRWDVSITPAKP